MDWPYIMYFHPLRNTEVVKTSRAMFLDGDEGSVGMYDAPGTQSTVLLSHT
jgi:hypothetical protein